MTEPQLRVWVERAQNADPEAWEQLYRHCHARLLAYARRRLATHEQAEDAVSETMARAIAGMDRFTWTGAGFDGWMFGILRNVVLETYRTTDRNPVSRHELVPDRRTDDNRPLEHVLHDEEASGVRAAFARLSPDDQELLELRVVSRLDADAVGAVVGRAAGAVRMAQSRALVRLRTFMEEG